MQFLWTLVINVVSCLAAQSMKASVQATREYRGKEASPTAWRPHRRWPSFSSCFAFCLQTYYLRRASRKEKEGRKEGRKEERGDEVLYIWPSFTQKSWQNQVYRCGGTQQTVAGTNFKTIKQHIVVPDWPEQERFTPSTRPKPPRPRTLVWLKPVRGAIRPRRCQFTTIRLEQHIPEFNKIFELHRLVPNPHHFEIPSKGWWQRNTKHRKTKTVKITTKYMKSDVCTFQKTHTHSFKELSRRLWGVYSAHCGDCSHSLSSSPLRKDPNFRPPFFNDTRRRPGADQ